MRQVNIILRVDSTKNRSLEELAAEAEANGMKVRHTIDELGLIAGSVSDSRLEQLRNLVGVKRVEADEEVYAQ